jgi:hypothetical protein
MNSQKFIQTAIQTGKSGKKFKRDLRKTSFNGYALTVKKLSCRKQRVPQIPLQVCVMVYNQRACHAWKL